MRHIPHIYCRAMGHQQQAEQVSSHVRMLHRESQLVDPHFLELSAFEV
jgi:hypothetical protein